MSNKIGFHFEGDIINLLLPFSNLMAAVSLLAPPPPVGHASTVLEWLGLLDLLELEGKFVGYSLKKVSALWDVELTSVRVVLNCSLAVSLNCGLTNFL